MPATLMATTINGTLCRGDSGSSIEVLAFSHVNIILGINSVGFTLPQSQCSIKQFFVDIARHTEWLVKIAFSDF